MKLYFAKGSCAMGPLISFHEAGIPIDVVPVDIRAHKLPDGSDFHKINPRGAVPALEMDDGRILTENVAIHSYVADKAPKSHLLGPVGSFERYEALRWLTFAAADLHRAFSLLFMPDTPDAYKPVVRQRITGLLGIINDHLKGQSWLAGDHFSVADAHTHIISGWAGLTGVDTTGLDNLAAFHERVAARPAVKAAIAQEEAAY